jgi:hypothetical protein
MGSLTRLTGFYYFYFFAGVCPPALT